MKKRNSANEIGCQKPLESSKSPLTREVNNTHIINSGFFCTAATLYESHPTHVVVGNEGSGACGNILIGVDGEASYEIDVTP